jgi:ribosomal protein S18 acetylase RimI-like enzyme
LVTEPSPSLVDLRTFSSSDTGHGTQGTLASINADECADYHSDWFDRCLDQTRKRIELHLPEIGPEKARVVRFELAKRPLFCQLGDWVPAKFPMQVARLSGPWGQIPDQELAYDRLFGHLALHDVDGVYLEAVRPETVLWRHLRASPVIQKFFRFYSPEGPIPHWLIRLSGSFNDYMKRFSPKTRKNRHRELKLLRTQGEVRLVRVTEASKIDAFLKAAYAISEKTRQFKQFGWSVAARDPRLVKNELLRLARRNWLRSYVLMCGNAACAFILGDQSGSRFRPVAAGVDPAWRSYSVGTILLLLALEDLFKENTPEFYDLGISTKHKEYLATDSYLEASVWLFRRRAYPLIASSVHRVCNLTSTVGGAALERLALKSKVVQWMRRVEQFTSDGASAKSTGHRSQGAAVSGFPFGLSS